jgi:SAM-dependent methyltransferase
MDLLDVVRRPSDPEPWVEGDNIPWHEPGFSARMLREHLSQEHDAASRRSEKIDRHVASIHATLLAEAPARVLDLGCGPGLYTGRLAALGHRCHGIDISPASIRHARERAAEGGWDCSYDEADLRTADYGRDHDLAMLLFGELNVFAPDDALLILRKAHAALRPGGRLLLEPHTLERVERLGAEPQSWWSSASGLFSDAPHLVLLEHAWHAERRAATVRYFVLDAATAAVERHAQTMQGYDEAAYRELLTSAGFGGVRFHASLTGSEADAEPGLIAITAHRAPDDGGAGDPHRG